MNEIINVIGERVVDAGIWKFILAWIFFSIALIIKLTKKESDLADKIMLIALTFMYAVVSLFLIIGGLQLIL